jgi:hypothetical protein
VFQSADALLKVRAFNHSGDSEQYVGKARSLSALNAAAAHIFINSHEFKSHLS